MQCEEGTHTPRLLHAVYTACICRDPGLIHAVYTPYTRQIKSSTFAAYTPDPRRVKGVSRHLPRVFSTPVPRLCHADFTPFTRRVHACLDCRVSGHAGEPPLHQHTAVNTPASTRIAAAALTHKDLKSFELFSSFEVRKFRGDPYTLRSLPWFAAPPATSSSNQACQRPPPPEA